MTFAVWQQPAADPSSGGVLSWLADLAARPGVVETSLALLLTAIAALVWLRLSRLVTRVRERAALTDYLYGVEQALAGDFAAATRRLQAVLAEDPENHYARLLLGRVLAASGEPAEAHKQHLYLQRAFAIESAENDLAMAQALLQVGQPAEAADAAERALAAMPEHLGALEFVFRARLAAGDHAAASVRGRQLLARRRDGTDLIALRTDVAHACMRAAQSALRQGDVQAARAQAEHARALVSGTPALRQLDAALAVARTSLAETVAALLPPPGAAAQLPVAAGPRLPVAAAPDLRALTALVPTTRWRCKACAGELAAGVLVCPHCGTGDSSMVDEPALFSPLASPTTTLDAIEENVAHVKRVVRAAVETDDPAVREAAAGEVLALRDKAVQELLVAAWQRSGAPSDQAVALLRQMGPAITPALFAACDVLSQQRLLPLGSRSPAAVVGRVVQGFDRAALPHVEELFASARADHRKILIDYFIELADPQAFQIVVERFPPLEILHRFNKSDGAVLRRFLQSLPPGHFVADGLLLDPAFYREDEVLAAIPAAPAAAVLEQVLLRRGPTRTLTKALIAALAEAGLADVAERLLRQFGDRMLDHALAAFTDQDQEPAVRTRLGRLLTALGAPVVDRLCGSFGPEPTSLDDELRAVLAAMGAAAVPVLQQAYGHTGWLERMTGGLLMRQTNRRVQIARTLQVIGGSAARTALRALHEQEKDANLRLRLQQLLHQPDGGADGQDR
ncbi:MAG: tetratricopeptide repeat protein [Planctomycetes bacterium]|nr:tetratricopeptide repeat protein [Planctomycetota bacterium]